MQKPALPSSALCFFSTALWDLAGWPRRVAFFVRSWANLESVQDEVCSSNAANVMAWKCMKIGDGLTRRMSQVSSRSGCATSSPFAIRGPPWPGRCRQAPFHSISSIFGRQIMAYPPTLNVNATWHNNRSSCTNSGPLFFHRLTYQQQAGSWRFKRWLLFVRIFASQPRQLKMQTHHLFDEFVKNLRC